MSSTYLAVADLPTVAGRLRENGSGRPRIDRVQGRDQLYRLFVQLAISTGAGAGWFRTSWGQLAAGLGYECTGDTARDGARYQGTIRRRADDLAAAGLIEYRPATTARGRIVCLEVRVLPGILADPETGAEVDVICDAARGGGRWGGTFRRIASGRKRPPVVRRGVGRQRPIQRPISFCSLRSAKSPLGSDGPSPLRGRRSRRGLHGPPRARGSGSVGDRSSPRNRAVGPAEGHGTPDNGSIGVGGVRAMLAELSAGGDPAELAERFLGYDPDAAAAEERAEATAAELRAADREWTQQLARRSAAVEGDGRRRTDGRRTTDNRAPSSRGLRPRRDSGPPSR